MTTFAEPPYPGMHRAGARLPLDEYGRRLWERRYFILTYSRASGAAGYQKNFLGQYWRLLTPLLNIAVYYLIFGLLLHTNRGVPNYIAYLSVGVFVFGFCTESLTSGAKSIMSNVGLVRALQFPRAVLPISTTLVALEGLLYSLTILAPIALLTGEPLSFRWLLLIPAVALQAMFCLGLAFVVARIGAQVPDTSQVLPFVSRVWMYVSGVMYSITAATQGRSPWLRTVLHLNPGSVYLQLARHALLTGVPVPATTWLLGVAWAVGLLSTGFLYFWRGEETYGNV